jgi:enoyl-CoA hydratase/carnithine racemase
MTAEHFVRYEIDDRVAVITLDRPAAANAQTPGVLADLDDAWRRADLDPEVRVIVLMTTGKNFSAGHDMSGSDPSADGRRLGPSRADGKLHTWELGPRKAKEMLFTAGSVTAEEARQTGMVNHVVPLDELRPFTMRLAHRIAQADPWALRMAKRAVNQTLDTMGFSSSIASCFDMHRLGHARALAATDGKTVVLADLARMKAAGRST